MTVSRFATLVSRIEGGKVNLTIAQISEVVKCCNTLTEGQLYKIIRAKKDAKKSKKAKK